MQTLLTTQPLLGESANGDRLYTCKASIIEGAAFVISSPDVDERAHLPQEQLWQRDEQICDDLIHKWFQPRNEMATLHGFRGVVCFHRLPQLRPSHIMMVRHATNRYVDANLDAGPIPETLVDANFGGLSLHVNMKP